ncbi:unnamed protein product [Polarella glacialis]|uniref:Uncharacterized protein n=1 Tax=Polarella glacialis TaxID=89957 RepID=A0A813E068_POLGL|nr:unnamed protein product [Polarella glacialis]CAE8691059.1 unnamed protein product [Polarella glacialis]CAE8719504.1 unnamed protein product [Polarella glacialis]
MLVASPCPRGQPFEAAEGGSPGACAGAEACVEEASEDDPMALLQARQPAAAAGADEDWWGQRAGRSVAAAGAVVGSMTGEEPAEASHTQAVQTQDPLTPSVGTVAVGGAANEGCRKQNELCSIHPLPWQPSQCCSGMLCCQGPWPGWNPGVCGYQCLR